MTNNKKIEPWFIYILECGDGSLYTGSTNDIENRVKTHSSGKGAKYTRSHLPVKLVYSEELENRSFAAKRESEIKKLTRKGKLFLIAKFNDKHNHPARHKNIPASYLVLKKNNKILLLRRFNTGFEDGNYGLVAGHVDSGETFTTALIREAKEESGIDINSSAVQTIHVMHRRSGFDGSERVDVFHTVEKWSGEIINTEPHKCDDLSWFDIDDLPSNIIDYVEVALNHINNNVFYSEYGW